MPRAVPALMLSPGPGHCPRVLPQGGLGSLILNEAAGPGVAGVRESGPWGPLCYWRRWGGGRGQEPSLAVYFKARSAQQSWGRERSKDVHRNKSDRWSFSLEAGQTVSGSLSSAESQ